MKMLQKKSIGVCFDNGVAYLLEEKNDENIITIIEADESQQKHTFFRKVFNVVKDFDKVSLFGPAYAKNELLFRIKKDRGHDIEVLNHPIDDKITENQKIDFIKEYFNT